MAITFNNTPPKWGNDGVKPTDEKTNAGYEVNDTLPADYLNYHLHSAGECIEELQTKLSNEDTERKNADTALQKAIDNEVAARKEAVSGVSKESIGLDKVDNTSDSEKAVAFASEAGVGRKVQYPIEIHLDGGRTEGTDQFTYDGSTSRSVNITPEKIGGAEKDLSNVDDEVFKEKVKSTVVTGTPIVTATSTDGVTYTATVEDITELYNGMEVIIIPNTKSTSRSITLNINSLGDVPIRRPLSFSTFVATSIDEDKLYFLSADTPCRLMYHANYTTGGIWLMADKVKYSAQDLYGTVPIESGGTGATTAKEALANLGGAQIQTGSYTGTGEFDDSIGFTLSFNFTPKMVYLASAVSPKTLMCLKDNGAAYVNGDGDWISYSFSTNSITFIDSRFNTNFNASEATYQYVAIG